ncbi:hypothetical protein F5Y14DRAFT_449957 [Nemania sp. NC0429]|nr:hypothetical protein F5Y14DRAFT_449957 [Nemania sp. NC0429]
MPTPIPTAVMATFLDVNPIPKTPTKDAETARRTHGADRIPETICLNRIDLVNYDDLTTPLSGGWEYTWKRDDTFTHAIGGMGIGPTAINTASDENSRQLKSFWVSTTTVENKGVVARIKLSDGKFLSSRGPPYNSHVTLTSKAPVRYTTDTISVSLRLVKADVYGYDTTGYNKRGHPGDSRLRNSYSFYSPDRMVLRLSFIWEFGSQTRRDVGLNSGFSDTWGGEWNDPNYGFTIYDIYGNWGKFSASFSDNHDLIKIKNAN